MKGWGGQRLTSRRQRPGGGRDRTWGQGAASLSNHKLSGFTLITTLLLLSKKKKKILRFSWKVISA